MTPRILTLACAAAILGALPALATEPRILHLDTPVDPPCNALAAQAPGLTLGAVLRRAKQQHRPVRVMRDDAGARAGTTDHRTDRLNLELKNGVVTAATCG